MYDVISIGDTMQDVFLEMTDETVHMHTSHHPEQVQICFTYADKIPVHAKHDTIGGNSANAAIAFERLGFKTAIYTHVGGDAQGKRIIDEFKKNGVASDYVVTDHDLESNYNTVINLHGERTILIYHVHRHFSLPKLDAAKWIYLSSMGEGFEKIFPDLIHYVKETGANLCYQPGTFQLKFGAEKSKELLKHTKIFLVNKEEAELYLGVPATNDFKKLLDGIRELGPEIVMISDGTKGAYATDGTQYLYMGIIKDAPRNEATGAGDSFSSAFIAALAQGKSLAEALRWGQCEASSVIQQIGPQAGLLKTAQMQHLLDMFPEMVAEEIGKPVEHPAEFVYVQPTGR
jgi:ribokinase